MPTSSGSLPGFTKPSLPIGQRRIPKSSLVSLAVTAARTKLAEAIQLAHTFVQRNVGGQYACAVSQRDLSRVFRALHFFYLHRLQRMSAARVEEMDTSVAAATAELQRACVLAIALVYYLRLTDALRMALDVEITDLLSPGGCLLIDSTLSQELTEYVKHITPGAGVTWNKALRENVFAIVVSIQLRFPVVIVGAPGSTKTLAFQTVRDHVLSDTVVGSDPFFAGFYSIEGFPAKQGFRQA